MVFHSGGVAVHCCLRANRIRQWHSRSHRTPDLERPEPSAALSGTQTRSWSPGGLDPPGFIAVTSLHPCSAPCIHAKPHGTGQSRTLARDFPSPYPAAGVAEEANVEVDLAGRPTAAKPASHRPIVARKPILPSGSREPVRGPATLMATYVFFRPSANTTPPGSGSRNTCRRPAGAGRQRSRSRDARGCKPPHRSASSE
jgi:hypothetical protein